MNIMICPCGAPIRILIADKGTKCECWFCGKVRTVVFSEPTHYIESSDGKTIPIGRKKWLE